MRENTSHDTQAAGQQVDEMVAQSFPNWPIEYMQLQQHCERLEHERQALIQMNQALHYHIEQLQKAMGTVNRSGTSPTREGMSQDVRSLSPQASERTSQHVMEDLLNALLAETQSIARLLNRFVGQVVSAKEKDILGRPL